MCLTLFIIREVKIKIECVVISYCSEWPLPEILQVRNPGEGVEKSYSSYTVGGNTNRYNLYAEHFGDSLRNFD